ncbi:MAG: DNA recombination protein RmuC [Hyphomicrobiales bacterium]|nr:DNA recombination protein RmuC [Hyphomicrobiales bacterium]
MLLAQRRAARERMLEAQALIERTRDLDQHMEALNQANAELSGRLQTMTQVLGSRQTDFVRLVSERLDVVGQQVGRGLEGAAKSTGEHLAALNERLAVIDAAQNRLTGLTQEVVGLKDILANKQARGAFGQGRMEAIVRDNLPADAYQFQFTLKNGTRPDCVISLPGDDRLMVVDAKFPLESFTALRDAESEDERNKARQWVRSDISRHVKDIAERYFIPGQTQDIAVMFVPAESLFADLSEHFDDLVQKAHRARILIVSPSLLMMAIQVMQAIVRDARVREQAHQIQAEVCNLVDDVMRLRDRVAKLDTHFRQAQEDVVTITTSSDKITRRGERIGALDFAPPESESALQGLNRAAE